MMLSKRFSLAFAFLLPIACDMRPAHSGDWPQILGPSRNGIADGDSVRPWAAGQLRADWTCELGEGYAGPAVTDEKIVVFHRLGDSECVQTLNTQTGEVLWKREFPATYRGGVDPDRGPRCVPLVHSGQVYVFGAAGDLRALALSDGRLLWSRQVHRDFSGLDGYFGAGSTPVIAGDRLLLNVGGRDEAGIVAFDLKDGKTLWKKTEERASYSSPVLADLDGKRRAIFVTRLNAMVIDPMSGEVAFQFPFGQRGPTVNAATPLVFDNHLFVTANYGVGAKLVRIGRGAMETVWESDQVLSSQYPTPVYSNGYLYGTHGREDVGVAELRCVEAKTSQVCWSVPDFGMAHLVLVGDRLLVLRIDGRLLLAEASPEQFKVLATATVSADVTRALPALANGKLYFRSNSRNGGLLTCIDLHP